MVGKENFMVINLLIDACFTKFHNKITVKISVIAIICNVAYNKKF